MIFHVSHILHGTAIYAAPLTPHGPPQLIGIYGSPMGRVWAFLGISAWPIGPNLLRHRVNRWNAPPRFHPGKFPLLAACSDDATVSILHAKVGRETAD